MSNVIASLSGEKIEEKYLQKYGSVFGTFVGTRPIFNTR